MQRFINGAMKQLEERTKVLQADAYQQLEKFKTELVESLKSLAELGLPNDVVDFYVKHRGIMWATQVFGVGDRGDSIRLQSSNMGLTLGEFRDLRPGLYKFICLAVPVDSKPDRDGRVRDEYGYEVKTA